jgi:hypothetical protein
MQMAYGSELRAFRCGHIISREAYDSMISVTGRRLCPLCRTNTGIHR